jgi:hypothetical protein
MAVNGPSPEAVTVWVEESTASQALAFGVTDQSTVEAAVALLGEGRRVVSPRDAREDGSG